MLRFLCFQSNSQRQGKRAQNRIHSKQLNWRNVVAYSSLEIQPMSQEQRVL